MKEMRMECLRTPYVVSPNPLASMAWTLPVRADALASRVVTRTFSDGQTDGRPDDRTMAAGASVT
jgi:hypothetical protein